MSRWRNLARAFFAGAFLIGATAAYAAPPPPVPPIADTNRYQSYTLASSTPTVDVNFPVFGDCTDIIVRLNGLPLVLNTDFTCSSTSGGSDLALLPLPITDLVITFATSPTTNLPVAPPASGFLEIIGAWHPRDLVQPTAAGIDRREFNQSISTLVAGMRELWQGNGAGASAGLLVGTTTVGSGTSGYVLYDAGGTLGDYSITGTAGSVVLSVSPTFTGTVGAAAITATGVVTESGSTASTSTTTGNVINSGGLGVAGAAWIGGLENVAGVLTASGSTASTSITSGEIVSSGGLGVTGAAWIGGLENVAGVLTASGSTASTSITSGEIVSSGGLGVTGAAWIGGLENVAGVLTASGSTASSSTTTGEIVDSGGLGVAGATFIAAITASGVVTESGTTASTSTTTGNVINSGGEGIAKALWVGGLTNVAGVLTASGSTASTSITSGEIVDSGGLGVNLALWVGGLENVAGVLTASGTTASTTTTTGEIVDAGGLGVAGAEFLGGALSVASTTASTSTTTGAIIDAGGLGVAGPAFFGGNITLGLTGTLGSVTMFNATTGSVTLEPTTGALGTVTQTLQAATGLIADLNVADQPLSGGATLTPYLNTIATGAITVDCGQNPVQYVFNTGAFTINAPANDGACILRVINASGSSTTPNGGAVTLAGFSPKSPYGVAFTNTLTQSAVSVTVTSSTGLLINWTAHGLSVNSPVYFTAATMPTGLTADVVYYVQAVRSSGTFTVSATPGGAAIAYTNTGTTVVGYEPSVYLLDIDRIYGATTAGWAQEQ